MARHLTHSRTTIALALIWIASGAAAQSHRLCLQSSLSGANIFYDITADSTITRLDRYDMSQNPPQFLNRNDYATLAQPNPAGSFWGDGVAFAATMQTRNAWVYPQESQTSAGYWDVISATSDRWRFQTTIGGAPTEVTFTTANCANSPASTATLPPAQQTSAPNSPAPTVTIAPPPQPTSAAYTAAPGTHRVCLQFGLSGAGSIFYDITTDMAQTVMLRYDMSKNPPLLVDTNNYAALAMPNPAGSFWGNGVAFAATMQTRNAWAYPGQSQTSAAWWDVIGQGQDRWRFQTTIGGAPFELTLTTANCVSSPKNT